MFGYFFGTDGRLGIIDGPMTRSKMEEYIGGPSEDVQLQNGLTLIWLRDAGEASENPRAKSVLSSVGAIDPEKGNAKPRGDVLVLSLSAKGKCVPLSQVQDHSVKVFADDVVFRLR